MSFSFRPISKTDPDNFDVMFNTEVVGTFSWKRNHPKPEDKVAIVHALTGEVGIFPNEQEACQWLVKVAVRNESEWAKSLYQKN
jgi:hypothetical protein